jgi:hypothetical protein
MANHAFEGIHVQQFPHTCDGATFLAFPTPHNR